MREAFREAVIFLGGVTETSRVMGVSRTAVQLWLETGIPPRRVLQLEAAMDEKRKEYQSMAMKRITRHELRPDIYPEP